MEHKDIWLVLGLTVILAVAVSVSTVSLTGDAIFAKKTTAVQKTPVVAPPIQQKTTTTTIGGIKTPTNVKPPFLGTCKYIELYPRDQNIDLMTPEQVCQKELGSEFGCTVAYTRWTNFYFDINCSEFKFMEPLYSESSSACHIQIVNFMGGEESSNFGKFKCTKKAALSDGWNQVGVYGAKRVSGYISGVTCCK